jgi:NitT/TauT family transport system ATP-binding protein
MQKNSLTKEKVFPELSLKNISIGFNSRGKQLQVLQEVSFEVYEGEFVSIVGPSGCGKSTVLNIISGLLPATNGEVRIGGELVNAVNPRLGYLFQENTLLPWRTVQKNVELGLELRGVNKEMRSETATRLIRQVDLEAFSNHYPCELSGGMKKRCELARTLAIDPEVFLMDEPFGALDAQTRSYLQQELLDLHYRMHKTILFVTHDLEEAVLLSDRVIILGAASKKVKGIHEVPLGRPRNVKETRLLPEFIQTAKKLWSEIDKARE